MVVEEAGEAEGAEADACFLKEATAVKSDGIQIVCDGVIHDLVHEEHFVGEHEGLGVTNPGVEFLGTFCVEAVEVFFGVPCRFGEADACIGESDHADGGGPAEGVMEM